MYSVVLLAAMTTSTAEAPGFHKRSFGCTGGMYLHSGCYGSCMGFSGGCCGGGGFNGWGGGGGCVGCWGCMGCYGVYTGPVMSPAGNPMTAPPPAATPPAPGSGAPKADTAKSAQLIIEKPADAKIYVDNLPVKSDGVTLNFATPALDPVQAYFYMVRVEMTRDGKPLSESRKVIVRAGQTIQETFSEQGIVTASLK
jgi:uncharacterized protein (TIGR03000 family)